MQVVKGLKVVLGPVITRFSPRWYVYLAWSHFEIEFLSSCLVVGRLIDGADSMNGTSRVAEMLKGKIAEFAAGGGSDTGDKARQHFIDPR